MHLLLQIDTTDYAAWKAAWDSDTEDRSQAGLTQLQLWRSADTAGLAFALLEVSNRSRADAWLAKERGFGATITSSFLKTV
jgi:hypothetical protein